MAAPTFRIEPNVEPGDFVWSRQPAWSTLDEIASRVIGSRGVAIPSVRVAMMWTLEYLGCRRNTHHVLVPRFMGRCILNSLNRVALPVEVPTPDTKVVVAVHQYGFTQRLEAVNAECVARSIPYIEDSAFCIGRTEIPGPGSLAKFVGFSKVLPTLKGGFALSDDAGLLEHIRRQRAGWSAWSWPLLAMMSNLRWGMFDGPYSVLGDLAYELYPEVRGDNGLFRSNVQRSLEQITTFEEESARRLRAVAALPRDRLHLPEAVRLTMVVPYRPAADARSAQTIFEQCGFDANLYHFDAGRNLFDPMYERVLLIPLNPRIPASSFTKLINTLGSLDNTQAEN